MEAYLFHLAQRVSVAEVPIKLDDFRVSVPQPLSDLAFRIAAKEALAAKEMAKRVKSAVAKTDVAVERTKHAAAVIRPTEVHFA